MTRSTQQRARDSGAWSAQEDSILRQARSRGMAWAAIAQQHFPHKSYNACRKRHERLMQRQNRDEYDGVRSSVLARAYMELREEMWRMLADRVGDRWETVELKCMEKGLKNIRVESRHAVGNSPDSGIGLGDADLWGQGAPRRSAYHDQRDPLSVPQQQQHHHEYPQYFQLVPPEASPHARHPHNAIHEPRGPSIQSMLSNSHPRGYDWSPRGPRRDPGSRRH